MTPSVPGLTFLIVLPTRRRAMYTEEGVRGRGRSLVGFGGEPMRGLADVSVLLAVVLLSFLVHPETTILFLTLANQFSCWAHRNVT